MNVWMMPSSQLRSTVCPVFGIIRFINTLALAQVVQESDPRNRNMGVIYSLSLTHLLLATQLNIGVNNTAVNVRL